MKIKHGFVILAVCLQASVSQAEFMTNGGFESGTLAPGWVDAGPYANATTSVVTSAVKDGQTITPHSGTYFVETDKHPPYGDISQTLAGGPAQGTLTFAIYRTSFTSDQTDPALTIHSGDADNNRFLLRWSWNSSDSIQIHAWSDDGGFVPLVTGVFLPTGQWVDVVLVADNSGVDLSVGGNVLLTDYQIGTAGGATGVMTQINYIQHHTGWGSMNGGYDSFSFVPEPMTLSLLGLGSLAVLRRKRA